MSPAPRSLLLLLASLALLAFATTAQADSITIGPDGCGSCAGLTLTLEANQVGDDVHVLLSYEAPTGWMGDPGWEDYTVIVQAGFKAATKWDAGDITLVSVKLNGSDYAHDDEWSGATEASTSSANPFCSKGTKSDKGCTYATTEDASVDLGGGGLLVFEFLIEDAKLLQDTLDWHIGGQLCDLRENPQTCDGHIISESVAVPEPSAALVFGIGLVAFAAAQRRRV